MSKSKTDKSEPIHNAVGLMPFIGGPYHKKVMSVIKTPGGWPVVSVPVFKNEPLDQLEPAPLPKTHDIINYFPLHVPFLGGMRVVYATRGTSDEEVRNTLWEMIISKDDGVKSGSNGKN